VHLPLQHRCALWCLRPAQLLFPLFLCCCDVLLTVLHCPSQVWVPKVTIACEELFPAVGFHRSKYYQLDVRLLTSRPWNRGQRCKQSVLPLALQERRVLAMAWQKREGAEWKGHTGVESTRLMEAKQGWGEVGLPTSYLKISIQLLVPLPNSVSIPPLVVNLTVPKSEKISESSSQAKLSTICISL
jgi:hypothetical protein